MGNILLEGNLLTKTLKNAQRSLTRAGLSPRQARAWAEFYDRASAAGADQGDSAARAWITFHSQYRKHGGKWVMQHRKTEALDLKFLILDEVQNPSRIEGDSQAPRKTLANRAFHLQRATPEGSLLWGIYEGHALYEDEAGTFHLQAYRGTGQGLKIQGDPEPILDEDAQTLVLELADFEHGRRDLEEVGKRNSARDEKLLSDIIKVGLDLLGDSEEENLFKTRRKARRKKARKKKQVSKAEHTRTAATGSMSVEEIRGTVEGVVAPDAVSHPSILAPTVDARRVSEIARRIILGDGLDENIAQVVQTKIYELATELDALSVTRFIVDVEETRRILDEAVAALESAKVTMEIGDGRTVQVTPAGFLGTWALESLSNQLRTSVHTMLRLPEGDANRLAATADDLRTWLAHTYEKSLPVMEVSEMVKRAKKYPKTEGNKPEFKLKKKGKKSKKKDDEEDEDPEKEASVSERLKLIKERALLKRKKA